MHELFIAENFHTLLLPIKLFPSPRLRAPCKLTNFQNSIFKIWLDWVKILFLPLKSFDAAAAVAVAKYLNFFQNSNTWKLFVKYERARKVKMPLLTAYLPTSVTRKKSPNVYKSWLKIISLEKLKILTPFKNCLRMWEIWAN